MLMTLLVLLILILIQTNCECFGLPNGDECDDSVFHGLLGNTLVRTHAGFLPLSEVQVGQMVWAVNRSSETITYSLAPIIKQFYSPKSEFIDSLRMLEVKAGALPSRQLITSVCQAFLVVGLGWTPAGAITSGMQLMAHYNEGGPTLLVINSTRMSSDQHNSFLYNIEVESLHSYLVSEYSVVTHNLGGDEKVEINSPINFAGRYKAVKKQIRSSGNSELMSAHLPPKGQMIRDPSYRSPLLRNAKKEKDGVYDLDYYWWDYNKNSFRSSSHNSGGNSLCALAILRAHEVLLRSTGNPGKNAQAAAHQSALSFHMRNGRMDRAIKLEAKDLLRVSGCRYAEGIRGNIKCQKEEMGSITEDQAQKLSDWISGKCPET